MLAFFLNYLILKNMAKVGRPPKFEKPEDMQKSMDIYFAEIEKTGEPPTICGLSEALGFEDRRSLLDYLHNKNEFTRTIKGAKRKIEQYLEKRLSQGQNVAGLIFNLKNNFGWVDKQEINTNLTGNLTLTDILSRPKQLQEGQDLDEIEG
jgi:hypothetical protein